MLFYKTQPYHFVIFFKKIKDISVEIEKGPLLR